MAATNEGGGPGSMAEVRLSVELLAPLCLAEDAAQGNETRTLPYVPGSALRGALAWHLLRGGEWRSDEDAFHAAFADEGVSFGDLTPGPGGRVVPLSARSCKLHPGFAADGDGHGVVDLLLPAARLSRESDAAAPLPGCCPRCGSALKAFGGGFVVGEEPRSARVPRSFHRFAARDPRTRAVQHSLLFTMEVIEPEELVSSADGKGEFRPVRLAGTLRGPLAVANDELQLVAADGPRPLLARGETLWVGRGRSRGFGALRVNELAPVSARESVAERLAAGEQAAGGSGFALTLESAAVLLDPWLRHLAAPTVAYLREAGLPLPEETRLVVCYAETRRVRRWNGLAGLPRADERAIAAGSAFWYALPRPATAIPGLVEALDRLEREGLGERRAEGFGRVGVADRFHLTLDHRASAEAGRAMETKR